ncbi:MAG: SUMF1/EgtB/PvdO family nonheme iron enzyme, partial [Bacteroidia bacterium]
SVQFDDFRDLENNMVLIPAQMFDTIQNSSLKKNDSTCFIKIDSIYMSRYEVSNWFYLYYLYALKREQPEIYPAALPDTLVWRNKLAYNEPYVDYYHRHPSYRDYPLVGVNYEQAINFCNWLTKTYNADPKRKFKKVRFDLPSKHEWWAAANGGGRYCCFSWCGCNTRNSKGQLMANFREVSQVSILRDSITGNEYIVKNGQYGGYACNNDYYLNSLGDITAPVNAYWPNNYGLYNMSGNVEEMVKEKGISKGGSWRDTGYYLQNGVEEKYTEVSSERGFRIVMRIEK